ncbi:type I restriction/modification system, restriction subunit [Campylobacter blaseri]|uniref:Type I restriction enzyme endonuclease subunit n=1 Tax=Campylobacter blaseri TaxID=2042961 RepID=A0A2P8QYI7_9BACT|nr:type I restriction endonuclease subunit R [Campylobacter blaseri]PSM51315.1 deoxyribonuclease HsdR [Campylobacter blaseri]PSM52459.1 deoxyribonuclease HsdR [Campylobacter blaseri]QKF86209.1 type I restriction/modification system, restriction subunit [Campylobacter blaseri]
MNPNISSERALQDNVIKLLKSMGYTFISKEENIKLRDGKLGEVVFKDILSKQLQKLNSFEYNGTKYPFSAKNIKKAIDDLNEPLNQGLMSANQKISEQLIYGNSYQEDLGNGIKKSFSFKYIDFENVENNIFHFTEEFAVSRGIKTEYEKTRRPDIVLFINGIPFGVIELKKSSISSDEGISQMLRNQKQGEIQELFKYIQITLAGNSYSPQYATTGTLAKFYATWEEDVGLEINKLVVNRTPSKLDSTIYSLFDKNRVIKLLHSFIVFDGKIKKIARYQQFFAIEEIMKKINVLDNVGKREGGLIWHTQGSGKSLTMVMLTRVIKREIANSKIILVTDRTDLDEQIHSNFISTDIETQRAKSGQDLISLIKSGNPVITTLVHKFETALKNKVVINEPNVFLLVDESHRTQSGDLHKAMKKTFPLSCYIGFTGTPLMKKEKSTIAKFGGLIHKYTIDQAIKDKAVLPLLYEGRLASQWVSDELGLQRKFEIISKDLSDEQKRDLSNKWARFQKLASSEQRLELIAFDINTHFKNNLKGTGLKAMLATSSKFEAIKYHKIFEELGDVKTRFVISAPDTREGNDDDSNKAFINEEWNKVMQIYGSEYEYLKKVKNEFINGDEIDILIVVDKLLTGFDAPNATVLYIDKELKEHNLLQAIARVNRLYDGKDFGFIIDYRGLLGNLDKALTSYSSLDVFDEQDLIGAVIDIKDEIARLKTFYSHLEELFKSIENKNDQESYEVFLANKEKRDDFYKYLSNYARALKLALSSYKIDEIFSLDEIDNYKSKMKFYANLRASVKIRYHEVVDFGKYEKQMQKLLDTYISADDVMQLTKLVNIFDEEFDSEIERVVGDNAKADAILSAVTAVVTEKKESNPAFYEKIAQKIKEILEQYKENRLTEEEKLKNAKDIRAMLTNQKLNKDNYPDTIKNKKGAIAFYDNMSDFLSEIVKKDEKILEEFTLKLDEIFKEVAKKPDWKNNNDVKDQIEKQIYDILWDLEDTYNVKLKNSEEIVGKLRNIGINNYE